VLSRQDAAPLAYIGGSLGTLIGADLLNLDKLPCPLFSRKVAEREAASLSVRVNATLSDVKPAGTAPANMALPQNALGSPSSTAVRILSQMNGKELGWRSQLPRAKLRPQRRSLASPDSWGMVNRAAGTDAVRRSDSVRRHGTAV
jgi:hypothetical protein